MNYFQSGSVKLAYIDEGEGEPVLLIHGFASNMGTNWIGPGWVKTLTSAGFRVIALDNRGHGDSDKLYNLEDYGAPIMAEDAIALLDHLGIQQAHCYGYSMGARICAFLVMNHPDRVTSLIFAGLGYNMVIGMGAVGPIAAALEAPSAEDVKSDAARTFRVFAESTNSDLKALAACIRSSREKVGPEKLGTITKPVLVAVGTNDVIAGSADKLAALIPTAEVLNIEGRDHMTAVGDKQSKEGVLAFLDKHKSH